MRKRDRHTLGACMTVSREGMPSEKPGVTVLLTGDTFLTINGCLLDIIDHICQYIIKRN